MWTPWSPCVNIKTRVGQCRKSRERFCMASDREKCANAEKDGVIREHKNCDMSECYGMSLLKIVTIIYLLYITDIIYNF